MTSRKYEKATTASSSLSPTHLPTSSSSPSPATPSPSSTFWKKSSISAIPGRPNLSASKVTTTTTTAAAAVSSSEKKMPSSFRAFEASVSDAWAVQDDVVGSSSNSNNIPTTTTATIQTKNTTTTTKTAITTSPKSSSKPTDTTRVNGDSSSTPNRGSESKSDKVLRLLASSDSIDLETLRSVSWSGLVPKVRSKVWKILCGYLPGTISRQEEVLQRKQEEYSGYVSQYFHTKDQDVHQDTYRQIHIDIPRMSPVIALFQQRCVQEVFERILYIWAIRHPASGYVQGINDLVTPFFLVFLQDHCSSSNGNGGVNGGDVSEIDLATALSAREIHAIEADSYWCLSKVLDGIQDNYTFAQPGIQNKVRQLEELVQRIDRELHDHLKSHEVLYLQFAFRWMNNILMRELPIRATIRLWDTYLSEVEGFSHFHLYVCAAFLLRWKGELMKKTDFHTLLMFLQNLPTAKWGDSEINLLVAEAYRLSYLFADAPNHLVAVAGESSVPKK